ncbi:MAG: hypothetical protein ACK55I_01370, partial [bacterium]
AKIERTTDGCNPFGFVRLAVHQRHAGHAAHTHGAEAESGDLEPLCAEPACAHRSHGQTPPRKSCLPSSTPA